MGVMNQIYRVQKIEDDNVTCVKYIPTEEVFQFQLNDLVRVALFGDPIYPYLQKLDSVCNAPDSDLWHTLIEADNYHALQLLQYVFKDRKVDCIYIDPPYNTGAKDWKYNDSRNCFLAEIFGNGFRRCRSRIQIRRKIYVNVAI